MGRGPGDKEHEKGQETQLILWLSLYWSDLPSEIPGPGARGKILSKEGFPLMEVDQVREHLNKPCI